MTNLEHQQDSPLVERMQTADLPPLFIDSFIYYYEQLQRGEQGLIAEQELRPVKELPDAEKFGKRLSKIGQEAQARTAFIKLNGGLGTSMGLRQAKSLLEIKDGFSFLEIIAHQAVLAQVPLVLMNSYVTEEDSVRALENIPRVNKTIPITFVQHRQPKINAITLTSIDWPDDPQLEWCPPGHGDLYVALVTSGMLDTLLEHGYEYAFVSNADNLGAVLEPSILGYFVENDLPFMMEVADRTASDKKGGHLARLPNGQLILRELAQCPDEDLAQFQDIARHRFFNTNNLWLHLPTLKQILEGRKYRLGLPMIRNKKNVDPRDLNSPEVYQLETAMGSAIGVIPGAEAIRVPRYRFAPVKKTNDLLAVRSDAYELRDDFQVRLTAEREGIPPSIQLDQDYYRLVVDLEQRFVEGPPSLVACDRMEVEGDIAFGRNVHLKGSVHFCNATGQQLRVEDELVLANESWPE